MSLKDLKKAELIELAEANDLDVDGLNKSEIVDVLEEEGISAGSGESRSETKAERQARLRARHK